MTHIVGANPMIALHPFRHLLRNLGRLAGMDIHVQRFFARPTKVATPFPLSGYSAVPDN